MSTGEKLPREVDRQAARLHRAAREHPTVLRQTVYIGTLGLLLALPLVGGAWLGSWLDGRLGGYSMRWTLSLMLVGLAVGAGNVYLFIREHE
ncbi:MAG TPA: AtpZ/AtpI family protein [Steroidobacteraceae bacterium]|nr:AtpZ/AtpI family protein [Steroidobacteraceae bacterium]